jgi:hypothetical protein
VPEGSAPRLPIRMAPMPEGSVPRAPDAREPSLPEGSAGASTLPRRHPRAAPLPGFSALSRQVKATTSLVSGAMSKRTMAVWLSTVSTRPVAPTG